MKYIQEFRRVTGKLRHWLEQLLVYLLRPEPRAVSHLSTQGNTRWIRDWYQLVMVVELDIKEYWSHGENKSQPKRSQE